MKTSTSHIPEDKQKELWEVVDIIQSISGKNDIRIMMIILFGSYARGDFVVKDIVSEWHNTLEYKSDFDILIITKNPTQEKNLALARNIEKQIAETPTITSPVSILVEDIHHVNARLEENRYFYLDIKREWILLYDAGKVTLKDARILTSEEALNLKKDDFDTWFSSANEFFIDYKNAYDRKSYKIAVFYLHQAAERYITAYLLVKTGYKPKSHDLGVLYEKVRQENWAFDGWFSLDTERDYFELLRRAYVDSRYSREYTITKEEIVFLEEKVGKIRTLVENLCIEEIRK
jgi:HEPN domain-containing protein/predicted nucleotidyltransferase